MSLIRFAPYIAAAALLLGAVWWIYDEGKSDERNSNAGKVLIQTDEDRKAAAIHAAQQVQSRDLERVARQVKDSERRLASQVDAVAALTLLQRDLFARINPAIVEAYLDRLNAAGIASDIYQQVSVPAAGAHKETPPCVNLGCDSSEHDLKAAAFALPHSSSPLAVSIVPAAGEPVNCMGVPTSCGKPLCSPGDHHPLCRLARQPVPADQLLAEKATAKASTEIQP